MCIRDRLDAGSPTVFLGDPQTWRQDAGFNALAADPRVQTLALDVTESDSGLLYTSDAADDEAVG